MIPDSSWHMVSIRTASFPHLLVVGDNEIVTNTYRNTCQELTYVIYSIFFIYTCIDGELYASIAKGHHGLHFPDGLPPSEPNPPLNWPCPSTIDTGRIYFHLSFPVTWVVICLRADSVVRLSNPGAWLGLTLVNKSWATLNSDDKRTLTLTLYKICHEPQELHQRPQRVCNNALVSISCWPCFSSNLSITSLDFIL